MVSDSIKVRRIRDAGGSYSPETKTWTLQGVGLVPTKTFATVAEAFAACLDHRANCSREIARKLLAEGQQSMRDGRRRMVEDQWDRVPRA